MTSKEMQLKIVTPTEIALTIGGVKAITLDTSSGNIGLLPRRLDCISALEPGILTFITADGNEEYVGVDRGIMVKQGQEVLVSTRQAVHSKNLEQLRERWKTQIRQLQEHEKMARNLLVRLQTEISSGAVYER